MEKHILELHIANKLTLREIGKLEGCNRTTVAYWLHKYGLTTQQKIKQCHCKCGEQKVENFKPGRYSICKVCFADLLRRLRIERAKDRKKQAVAYKGGKCVRCGYSKCIASLHFHHVSPEKKSFSLSKMLAKKGFEAVKDELDKCELLCANCHGEEHWNDENENSVD